jgi:hypothetical protein
MKDTYDEMSYKTRRFLRKNAGHLFSLLIIALGLPVSVLLVKNYASLTSKASGEAFQVFFSPANQSLPPDSTFTVMGDAGTNQIGFIRIKIKFDPTKVSLNQEITPSTFFKTIVEKTAMAEANTTGEISLVEALSPLDSANPPSGVMQIANLSFTSASNELNQSSTLTIDPIDIQIVDVNSVILPTALSSATLSLNSSGGLTPSLTPVVTPTTVPSTTPTSIAQVSTLEAETMNFGGTNAVQIFDDANASGRKGLVFLSNASATGNLMTTQPTTQLIVRARGDSCKGSAKMSLNVDGIALKKSVSISDGAWALYTVSLPKSAGSHPVSISFTNDYSNNTCDRNLRVDALWVQ